ncbi:MAG: DUF4388 domain-containing protein, partial [Ktedonobacteraceae bacterium]|nr:DUF4388 domain-containing protein [Ktedonobacteraceae bacterium]
KMMQQIRRIRAFGRLSLRNPARFSIVHLYFRAGRLAHAAGNRGAMQAILADLREWQQGIIRFERGMTTSEAMLNDEYEQMLMETLSHLQQLGIIHAPRQPRVVDSRLIETSVEAEQLITPAEWRVLAEAMRRVSLAVSHLVGAGEALKVLQDIIDDCAAAFPAFACLKVAASGYLHVTDLSHFDRIPRQELLDGFAVLISTCQYFCVPLIGEGEAHRLVLQVLGDDIGAALANLGVFRVDDHLLARNPARRRSQGRDA